MNGVAATLGDRLQRLDGVLRTWAVAGLSRLVLALLLAVLMLLGS